MLATTRPSGAPSTAASSPGPSSTVGGVPSRAVIRAIRPNSPTSATVIMRFLSVIATTPSLLYVLPRYPASTTKGRAVVQAYILIQTEVGKAASVAKAIANIKGVTQAEDVTGPSDLILRADARNVDEPAKVVVR